MQTLKLGSCIMVVEAFAPMVLIGIGFCAGMLLSWLGDMARR